MIIDSHCHIDFSEFDNDRAQVLQRASINGIEKIIVPGVMKNTWQRISTYCEEFSMLFPCYGLHPYFIKEHKKSHIQDLQNWLNSSNPIAIGECGLDFFLKHLDRDLQIFYFEQQLDVAIEFKLPVVIHARKSTEAVINAIKKRPALHGMIHSFSGSYEQAMQLINMGFYLSFGGPVTYEKSSRLRALVQKLPLDAILVETDAPDQSVANASGKRNEPSFITDVVQSIADLKNVSTDIISQATSKNTLRLFNI